MLVAMSVRRLKSGSYDDFRRAWEPPDGDYPEGFQRAFHVRRIGNPDEIVSFGFVDRDASELETVRSAIAETQRKREEAMAPYVEELIAEGIYEVVEEVVPVAGASR
jgi:hypothetical protein